MKTLPLFLALFCSTQALAAGDQTSTYPEDIRHFDCDNSAYHVTVVTYTKARTGLAADKKGYVTNRSQFDTWTVESKNGAAIELQEVEALPGYERSFRNGALSAAVVSDYSSDTQKVELFLKVNLFQQGKKIAECEGV